MYFDGKQFIVRDNYTPPIEFIEVTDNGLRRYWPDSITRIVFTLNNPKIKGKNEFVIAE